MKQQGNISCNRGQRPLKKGCVEGGGMREAGVKLSLVAMALCLGVGACTAPEAPRPVARPVELKHFPLDRLEEVRATTGVSFDPTVSSDGKGALRLNTKDPLRVPQFTLSDFKIWNAVLLYQA